MRIRRISKRFDKDQLFDAYTGAELFKGQFATFEGRQVMVRSIDDAQYPTRRTTHYLHAGALLFMMKSGLCLSR